jgi:hypothetical protein
LRAHLGFEGGVLKLLAALDCEGSFETVRGADVNGVRVGKTTAAEGVLVEKVALFPSQLDAAATLLDEERVLAKGVSTNTAKPSRFRALRAVSKGGILTWFWVKPQISSAETLAIVGSLEALCA